MTEISIDLSNYTTPASKVFSGQSRGKDLRQILNIEKYEKGDYSVSIIIPEDTYSVNPSFFLGFLGKTVKKLGEEVFNSKFKFICSSIIKENINEGIKYSLKYSSIFDDEKGN